MYVSNCSVNMNRHITKDQQISSQGLEMHLVYVMLTIEWNGLKVEQEKISLGEENLFSRLAS